MNDNDDDEFTENDDSLITPAEKAMLDEILRKDPLSEDETELKNAELDNTDDDGDLLNEKSSADDASGNDLDVPGAEDDDADEEIGNEDEENNGYSKADTE
jgi:hypothetical protein